MELHWTEIDGVATVWTEAPEPLRASLLFRTGRIYETPLEAGYTHLVEHLALSGMPTDLMRQNGWVGGIVTGFATVGRPEEVVGFFRGLCEGLRSLPADKLADEKKIIEAELAGRSYDPIANALQWRFGLGTYGMTGVAPVAMHGATIDRLQALATSRFTAQNAVLWLSGPPPADLHLRLAQGAKADVPALVPIHSALPGWYVDSHCGGVIATSIVPRVPAAPLFRVIALKRLHGLLRSDRAVSYSPSVLYDPLVGEAAHLVLWGDSDHDHRRELAAAFGEFYEGLSSITDADIETARDEVIEMYTGSLSPPVSERPLLELSQAGMEWILGGESRSLESAAEEARSVTGTDMMDLVRNMQATTIFAVHRSAAIHPWMGRKLPVSVGNPVEGERIARLDAATHPEVLVHGAEGLSMVWPDGSHRTARYQGDLAAATVHDDGYIGLFSGEGTVVEIEPTLWQDGARVGREVRARVPAELILDQGARPSTAIPQPDASPSPATVAAAAPAGGPAAVRSSRTMGIVLTAAGAIGLGTDLLVLGPLGIIIAYGETDPVMWVLGGFLALVPLVGSAALLYGGIRILKRAK